MALTKTQEVVVKTLASSPLRSRFYWTGGTLLAEKYLQHRRSDDLDFFSDTKFEYDEIIPLIREIKKKTKLTSIEENQVFDRWEFFLHNDDEVRFEFVYYQFPKLRRRTLWQDVYVDSLKDLAANKVMALIDRHQPKDVIDIYFLATKLNYSLKKLLTLAKKKFGVTVDKSNFLGQALVGCEHLERVEPLLYGSRAKQKQTIKDAKRYFERLSRQYLGYYLK